MFSSHLRSWEMMVPRKRKDSAVSTGESLRVMGVSGAGFLLKYNHLHCFQSIWLQVVLPTPGHQMVNLPPVSGFAVIQGEEKRGKNAALRGTGADGPGVRDMF